MTTSELAQRLEVDPTTIKNWEKAFNLSIPRDQFGNRQYNEQMVAIYDEIARLKKEDKSKNEIQEAIDQLLQRNETSSSPFPTDIPLGRFPVPTGNPGVPAMIPAEMLESILQSAMNPILQTLEVMKEKDRQLQDAQFHIGRLEERTKNLEHQMKMQELLLREKEEKILLLMAPKELPESPDDVPTGNGRDHAQEQNLPRLTWWEKLFRIRKLRGEIAAN